MRWLSLALAAGLLAPLPAPAGPDANIRRAVELGYAQQYDSAWAALDRLPGHDNPVPLVSFWRSALLQMLLYDSGSPALADSFHRVSERTLTACRRRWQEEPADAEAHLLYGLTQLNRANCLGWQRQRLRAVTALNSASRSLKRAAELDPALADAWYGLGVVEYFRGSADRYALGLGLLGSRAKAYELMARARAGNGWLASAVDLTLAFMHKQDGNHREAIVLCERLWRRHPGNRSALRLLRDSHLAAGEWKQTLSVCATLDSSIKRNFPDNRYGLAENRLAALKAWDGLGRQDSVRAYAERLIAWSPYEQEVPWLAGYIAEARQFLRKLE